MNDWIGSLDFSIFGAAILLSVMGLWFTAVIPGIDHWGKRFFTGYFIIFLFCDLSAILEMVFQYFGVPSTLFIFNFELETLLLALPLPMLTIFLLHCCSENLR